MSLIFLAQIANNMISILSGKVLANSGSQITILTPGGVGYEVMVNLKSAQEIVVGSEVRISTYMAVRENAMELYGFANANEKDLFTKFLLVGGIGPKTALHLLSLGTVNEISAAIARGDVDYLKNVSGIGKKTAERIVVELQSRIKDIGGEIGDDLGGAMGDAVEGLVALGYSSFEARDAVKKIDAKGKTSEQLLKEALQRIK